MDLNERIRQMFDLVFGSSISSNLRSLLQNDQPSNVRSSGSINITPSTMSLRSLTRFKIRNRLSVTKKRSERSQKSCQRIKSDHRRKNNIEECSNNSFAAGLSWPYSDISQDTTPRSCYAYYIYCNKHKKIAFIKPNKERALWMTHMKICDSKPLVSWEYGSHHSLLIMLSNSNVDLYTSLKNKPPFSEKKIIEVAAIQLPQTMEMINRITWLVKIDNKNPNYQCCQDNEQIIWIDEDQVRSGLLEYMWGPEVIDIYRSHIHNEHQTNLDINNSFVEYDLESAFQFLPRNPPRTDEEALLLSANISEKDIERLYNDYLYHCFPAMSMAFHSFRVYLHKYGLRLEDDRLMQLFFAFNYNSNGSITFPELLMGLACIDSHSTHNEVRAKFVMRYYDIHKRNYLTIDDIRQMINTIHAHQSNEVIEDKLRETMQGMQPFMTDLTKISYKAFVSAVGSHRFRGTSKLCRLNGPVFQRISNIMFARRKKRCGKELKMSSVLDPSYSGTCSNCREKKPTINEQLLRIDHNGYISSSTKLKLCRKKQIPGQPAPEITPREEDELTKLSLNLIKMIREFNLNKGDTKQPIGLMANNNRERQQFYEWLMLLEKRLIMLFKNEQRCVSVSSPTYIIGDIHGNIEDLITLENCLWKRYPIIDCNLVFLGDYVDRGKWSVECVIYLFALKILMPNNVTMIRGNHEVRPLQAHYSYKYECLSKYGDDYGNKIWELTNRIFDHLPLCAIIDDAIFCSHGGIPRSTVDINDIQKLDNNISEPEHGHPIAWEILWSDPIHQQQFLELSCLLNYTEDQKVGFLPNRRRGTAFVFNEDAATRFLKQNNLTHIIRAHEVPTNGFFFHFDKKCATIFSSSHYCGNNNECAVILVDGDTIRIIRIDTTNNKSATN